MPAEFEKLVSKIKAGGSAKNPYAVARGVLGTDAQIIARRGTGKESKMGKKVMKKSKGKFVKGKKGVNPFAGVAAKAQMPMKGMPKGMK